MLGHPGVSLPYAGSLSTAPPIDGGKQEQPDDVDKMPIPCGGLKTEVMVWLKVIPVGPSQANTEKDRTNKYVGSMEASSHEKC